MEFEEPLLTLQDNRFKIPPEDIVDKRQAATGKCLVNIAHVMGSASYL
jgi:hypothetical protein